MLLKAHIYELVAALQKSVDQVVALSPVKTSAALPEDFWNVDRPEGAGESAPASPPPAETEDPDFVLQKEKEGKAKEEKGTLPEDEKMDTIGQGFCMPT